MARMQAVLIGLVALILTPGALFYFDVTPKAFVLLVGAAALCFTRVRRVDTKFSVLLALSLAAFAVATVFSPRPALSLYGSTWRRYGLVIHAAVLLVAWFAHQLADRATVLRGVSIAGAISALYGIAQYFGWDPILAASGYHIGEGMWTIVRPPGTFGYVSYFATWLLVCGFFGFAWKTRIRYAITGICWGAMLLTGTRAAILGLVVGLAVCVLRDKVRIPGRALVAGALVLAAAAAFYFSPAGWNLRSRSRWFVEDPWGGARPLLWRDSVRMALNKLAVGHGPETFTDQFARMESSALASAYPDFAHESPHNILLDALTDQGVAGVLALLGICVYAWRTPDRLVAGGFIAGLVAQQFTVFTIPTALLFYATAALGAPKPSTAIRLPRFLLTPIAAAFLFVAFRMTVADHSLALVQQDLATADLQSAHSHFSDYQEQKFPGASADLWHSRALFSIAQNGPDALHRLQALQMAAVAATTAATTAEDPFDAWYTLANIRAAQGDAPGTEAALRNSISAKPNWFKPHWMLARLLELRGARMEALEEARAANSLSAGKFPEVSSTLNALERRRD